MEQLAIGGKSYLREPLARIFHSGNDFWGEGLLKGRKRAAEVVVPEKLGAVGGQKMFLRRF